MNLFLVITRETYNSVLYNATRKTRRGIFPKKAFSKLIIAKRDKEIPLYSKPTIEIKFLIDLLCGKFRLSHCFFVSGHSNWAVMMTSSLKDSPVFIIKTAVSYTNLSYLLGNTIKRYNAWTPRFKFVFSILSQRVLNSRLLSNTEFLFSFFSLPPLTLIRIFPLGKLHIMLNFFFLFFSPSSYTSFFLRRFLHSVDSGRACRWTARWLLLSGLLLSFVMVSLWHPLHTPALTFSLWCPSLL